MGRIHSIPRSVPAPREASRTLARLQRAADVVVGVTLLVLAAPLIAVAALAVRVSSHGPVLQRARVRTRSGANAELLSFRTLLDGGGTHTHERLRAVVGAGAEVAVTPVGRVLVATRLHRLPRLVNVVAGHTSLFRRAR
jgi:lipopolysaccharide/colanic/teichoic acid biosynthesis glycosyltransferase